MDRIELEKILLEYRAKIIKHETTDLEEYVGRINSLYKPDREAVKTEIEVWIACRSTECDSLYDIPDNDMYNLADAICNLPVKDGERK